MTTEQMPRSTEVTRAVAPTHRYQRVLYGTGLVLVAVGLLHGVMLVIDDPAWWGNVSWRVFTKLGIHDRAQAVILAYETGRVTPGG